MGDVVLSMFAIGLFVVVLTTIAATVIQVADNSQVSMTHQEIRTSEQVNTIINSPEQRIEVQASSTKDEEFWTTDLTDDVVYKYDTSGSFVNSFALTAANADPSGITTDANNIWVVDVADAAVYKYDMTGSFDSSFTLTAANSDPQGITMITR